MKSIKLLWLLFLLLVIFTVLIGCQNTPTMTYSSEQNDMKDAIAAKSYISLLPSQYKLNATVELKQEQQVELLHYEVLIEDAKIEMNNIVVSLHLDPGMEAHTPSSLIFVTTLSGDASSLRLAPNNADIKGISLSRSLALDTKTINYLFLNRYRTMYVKVSYGDGENRKMDYIKVDGMPIHDTDSKLHAYRK